MVVLGVLVVYYIWQFVALASVNKQITQTQTKINNEKQEALSTQNRDQLLVRQQQIKSLQGIIASHPYWSQMFPELAKVTLKTASYSSLRVGLADNLNLSVTVPSLADLDKYMMVFDQPEFNKNFYNIRINGFTKVQGIGAAAPSVQFQVEMSYNPSLIQYTPPAGQ